MLQAGKFIITMFAGLGVGNVFNRLVPEDRIIAIGERVGLPLRNVMPFVYLGIGVMIVFLVRRKLKI